MGAANGTSPSLTLHHLPRSLALGTVPAGGVGFALGGGSAGLRGHPASGAQEAGHEVGDGEVGVEGRPVQGVAVALDLDAGEIGIVRPIEPRARSAGKAKVEPLVSSTITRRQVGSYRTDAARGSVAAAVRPRASARSITASDSSAKCLPPAFEQLRKNPVGPRGGSSSPQSFLNLSHPYR